MMTSRTAGLCTALMVVLGVTVSARPAAPVDRQIAAGELASWGDRSTWSTPNPETGRTEVGMGLVVSGSSGPVRLAFFVTQSSRGAASEPSSIGFRVAATMQMNPNLIRRPTLFLEGAVPSEDDPDTLEEFAMDLSSSMTVNNPAPNSPVNSGVGQMSADRLRTLADAVEMSGEILGAPVSFSDAQIEAIKAFCDKLLPEKS